MQITKITAPTHLGKTITFKKGVIDKQASPLPWTGVYNTEDIDVCDFPLFLNGMTTKQGVICGVLNDGKKTETLTTTKNMGMGVPRIKENFHYPETCYALLDHDPYEYADYYTPSELINVLSEVDPQFKEIAYTLEYSSSAGLNGSGLNGAGYHLWIACNGGDVKEYFDSLFNALAIKGYGYLKITSAGTVLKRGVFDNLVFSPERFVFTAKPIVAKNITQERPDPKFVENKKDVLDISRCVNYDNESLICVYDDLLNGKGDLPSKLRALKAENKEGFIKRQSNRIAKQNNITRKKAKRVVLKMLDDDVISEASVITLNTGETITIKEAIENKSRYDKKYCYDIFEPEFGKGKMCLYLLGEKPFIKSYLHGGKIYYINKTIKEDVVAKQDMQSFFDRFVIVESTGTSGGFIYDTITGKELREKSINAMYGDSVYPYIEDEEGEIKTTYKLYDALIHNFLYKVQRVNETVFDPSSEYCDIKKENEITTINTYKKNEIEEYSVVDDCEPIIQFFEAAYPNEKTRFQLLGWIYNVINKPDIKIPWSPILQGCEGSGKTLIYDIMACALGSRHTYSLNKKSFKDNFNGNLQNKLLIAIDDVDMRMHMEEVKAFVTNATLSIRAMHQDGFEIANTMNVMFMTNHKDYIPIKDDSRRYAPFCMAQQSKDDLTQTYLDFMTNLYNWLKFEDGFKKASYYFSVMPDVPDSYKHLETRAPKTEFTDEIISFSFSKDSQYIKDLIESQTHGFRDDVIFKNYFDDIFKIKKISNSKRQGIFKELGYVRHTINDKSQLKFNTPDKFNKLSTIVYVLKGSESEHYGTDKLISLYDEQDAYARGYY